MADPLLSSLCTICRTSPPKYVCPACSAGTCSLPCNQKHKAWANCSGKRDPTAYMPVSKLKTPAGVDHDYNFLSSIERERDRNQREVVEEKGLFTPREVREMDNEKRWRKMWFGEEVHFVAAGDRSRRRGLIGGGSDSEEKDGDGEDEGRGGLGRRGGGGKVSHLARRIRQRLEMTGVQIVHMPTGMSRQRENTTAWNRRTNGINWCVEWIVYGSDGEALKQCTHIRHKALESTPLCKAIGDSTAWQAKGQDLQHDNNDDDFENTSLYARKRRRVLIREVKEDRFRSAMQNHHDETATWLSSTPYPTQSPYTATWDTDRSATVSSWLGDAEMDARRSCRFYLLKPLTPVGKPKELIPLNSTDTLGSALQGRMVLEYPTIYVLPPSQNATTRLPEGYILSSTERRAPPPRQSRPEKRRATSDQKSESTFDEPSQKRQATGRGGGTRGGRGSRGSRGGAKGGGRKQHERDIEEGEINSDAADTTSSDPDTSSDEEEEGESMDFALDQERRMDIDSPVAVPKVVHFASQLPPPPPPPKRSGVSLVDYGSDTDDDDEEKDEHEDTDVSKLDPENPALVAGAIREIVGLLS